MSTYIILDCGLYVVRLTKLSLMVAFPIARVRSSLTVLAETLPVLVLIVVLILTFKGRAISTEVETAIKSALWFIFRAIGLRLPCLRLRRCIIFNRLVEFGIPD